MTFFKMTHRQQKPRSKQQGIALVEFTLIATFLLFLLIGIMEMARLMYSMQSLSEMTRRGARLAAVCYVSDQNDIPALNSIVNIAPKGFLPQHLIIEYLDADGVAISGDLTTNTNFAQIRFVSARIDAFNYQLLIPFVTLNLTDFVPSFQTIIPAESLGVLRPTSSNPTAITNC
jgi:hypothetical protein